MAQVKVWHADLAVEQTEQPNYLAEDSGSLGAPYSMPANLHQPGGMQETLRLHAQWKEKPKGALYSMPANLHQPGGMQENSKALRSVKNLLKFGSTLDEIHGNTDNHRRVMESLSCTAALNHDLTYMQQSPRHDHTMLPFERPQSRLMFDSKPNNDNTMLPSERQAQQKMITQCTP
eukprot:1139547-Pelagomonas_calceolata.AAC.21